MSVSAAELPAMSQVSGEGAELHANLRRRLAAALQRIAFFVIPSAAAFLFLGDVAAGALFQTGRFTPADTRYAWYLLMGSGIGLLASTSVQLYASAFYALKDTRTPVTFAIVRVATGAVLALYAVRVLPGQIGVPAELGATGITLASGMAAWLEYHLLRRRLARRIGDVRHEPRYLLLVWSSAIRGRGHCALSEVGASPAFRRRYALCSSSGAAASCRCPRSIRSSPPSPCSGSTEACICSRRTFSTSGSRARSLRAQGVHCSGDSRLRLAKPEAVHPAERRRCAKPALRLSRHQKPRRLVVHSLDLVLDARALTSCARHACAHLASRSR
jgi:hypothetical protein